MDLWTPVLPNASLPIYAHTLLEHLHRTLPANLVFAAQFAASAPFAEKGCVVPSLSSPLFSSMSLSVEGKVLSLKLWDIYCAARKQMQPQLSEEKLQSIGIDSLQFDLVEETVHGGPYFHPMSQERLSALDKRPDFKPIGFWEDDGRADGCDSAMVNAALFDQLNRSRDSEDWEARDLTVWRLSE
jgi:hypothetical protein